MKEQFWGNNGEFTIRHIELDAPRDYRYGKTQQAWINGEASVGDSDPGVTGLQVTSKRGECKELVLRAYRGHMSRKESCGSAAFNGQREERSWQEFIFWKNQNL